MEVDREPINVDRKDIRMHYELNSKYLKTSWEMITPEKAEKWLAKNETNRPLSVSAIARIVAAILGGAWKLNGASIIVDAEGRLVDGQHRLTAIVRTGIAVPSLVVRGIEEEAYDTIDNGNIRSLGDVMAKHGVKHYNSAACSIKIVARFRSKNPKIRITMRRDLAMDLYYEVSPKFDESVQFVMSVKIQTVVSIGTAAGMHFLMAEKSRKMANEFWAKIASGEHLTKTDPEYQYRERMLRIKRDPSMRPNQENVMGLSLEAWDYKRKGKPCRKLKWTDGDDFIKII